ncbi:MAG: heavy-metal-associated domain-containing protein, partial [Bryobacterales bacterium]|nr:heavy-metal-associated domain-containing protein [Bryobacterales bacterium]
MTETLSELTLPISGMTCASCVSHVEGALKELAGVSRLTVNLATNKANLSFDPG